MPAAEAAPVPAREAARLFADVDRNRVRKCENCVGHFYDNSKKGNRRWCSMQLCGNRLKVAAYAARKRRERAVEQRDSDAKPEATQIKVSTEYS